MSKNSQKELWLLSIPLTREDVTDINSDPDPDTDPVVAPCEEDDWDTDVTVSRHDCKTDIAVESAGISSEFSRTVVIATCTVSVAAAKACPVPEVMVPGSTMALL